MRSDAEALGPSNPRRVDRVHAVGATIRAQARVSSHTRTATHRVAGVARVPTTSRRVLVSETTLPARLARCVPHCAPVRARLATSRWPPRTRRPARSRVPSLQAARHRDQRRAH